MFAIPASAVIASLILIWLAVSNPDYLVVEDEEYERLRSELKAQPASLKDELAADEQLESQSTLEATNPKDKSEGKDQDPRNG